MCYCPTPTLHLNLALTGDCAFQLSPKKLTLWFISVLKSGDMGQCPEKSPSPCNTCVIPVSLYKSMSWFVTKTHTHTLTLTHTHSHTHTHTHSRSHTHTHTHSLTHSLTLTLTLTHTHTHRSRVCYRSGCCCGCFSSCRSRPSLWTRRIRTGTRRCMWRLSSDISAAFRSERETGSSSPPISCAERRRVVLFAHRQKEKHWLSFTDHTTHTSA